MSSPETRYAASGGGYVAYQVFGSGPPTVLLVSGWLQNLDAMWEEPALARYVERIASFSQVICFDKRGSGVSDPMPLSPLPTIEQWMDDGRTVLDAVGVERAAVIGDTEGGPMAIMLAASLPARVTALVLINTFARWLRAEDYPIGMPLRTWERLVDRYEQHWGVTADVLQLTAPSVAHDRRFRDWYLRYQRLAMPRGAATATYRWVTQLDVRSVLPSIRVPTLVVHRVGNRHHARPIARHASLHRHRRLQRAGRAARRRRLARGVARARSRRPRSPASPMTVHGFSLWAGEPGVGAPHTLITHGSGEVPVWFVPEGVFLEAVADGELTIGELAALPGRLVGLASHFEEMLQPVHVFALHGDQQNVRIQFR